MKSIYTIILFFTALSSVLLAQEATESIPSEPAEAQNTHKIQTQAEAGEGTSEQEDQSPISPQIFDSRHILNTEQRDKITEAQQRFLEKYNCVVSYGFYDGNLLDITVHQTWKDFVNKDRVKHFHLFLNIGQFIESNSVSVYYRYPPPLENIKEVDYILGNLKRDLEAEFDLNSVLERSFMSVDDELTYLKNKPIYENKEQQKVHDFEAEKLKAYIKKVVKIAAWVLIPLIAILALWFILSKILNRRAYRFPDIDYTTRLGAKSGATCISQIRK